MTTNIDPVATLFKKLNDTLIHVMPHATKENVDIALSALNSLLIALAIHNGVTRESVLEKIAYTYDEVANLLDRTNHEIH